MDVNFKLNDKIKGEGSVLPQQSSINLILLVDEGIIYMVASIKLTFFSLYIFNL